MAVIAFMNQKGGVGKTTTVIELAYQSSLNYKTLMVDADKQANLTKQFLDSPENTIREVFLGKDTEPVKVKKNLHLLPSSIGLAGVDLVINHEPGRESRLKEGLDRLSGNDHHYHQVFIDCPPDLSLITINALVASDFVVIPIKAAKFSLEGVEQMIDFVRKVRNNYNPNLVLLGLLITQWDDRLKIGSKIHAELKKNGWDKALFKNYIRKNTDVENAQFERKSIFEFNKRSHAAMDYAKLGKELKKKMISLTKNMPYG